MLDGVLDVASKGQRGTIELAFRLDVDNRPYQILDDARGKLGITRWEVLSATDTCTRVSFVPITGRTHQLRVHAAHPRGLGLPIVGDPLYGNGTGPGQMKLHACELGFLHPRTNEPLVFRAAARF